MGWKIEIQSADFQRLREHLRGEVEQVAFLFTEPYAEDQRLRVRGVELIAADGFDYQSGYHVELADEIRPELIKQAWDENACIIEAHSHLHGPAQFSGSDLVGLGEWASHMRWRLQGRPYAALVVAPDDFDALVWDGDGPAAPVEAVEIIGGGTLVPTGQTHRALTGEPKNRKPTSRWRRIIGR